MKKFTRTVISLSLLTIANFACASTEPGEEIIDHVLALGLQPPTIAAASGSERSGPYKRLVIKNINVIDGTGAPTRGPMTITIEGDRIVAIDGGITASLEKDKSYNNEKTHIIDGQGKFLLPGMIDIHSHIGTPTHAFGGALTDPNYVFNLLLAHGITTVRDVGSIMGLEWTVKHKELSERGDITAPRIKAYAMFPEEVSTEKQARKWIRAVEKKGADGIKFLGAAPEIIIPALEEAKKLELGTAFHHSQMSVTRTTALDTARLGLDSMEHWYGLPEAMFADKTIQHYPSNYNYNDEQDRFGEAGRLWAQTSKPGSQIWKDTINEMVRLDFTMNPTLSVYEASRDIMRVREAEWHDDYTMPYIMRAFAPNPDVHGSFFFDWTTADEISWKENYKLWMNFVNDFKNAGGRIAAGSDAGFIYSLYGFGYVRELELLQEAGFHPLEVIKSATLNGAELLGLDHEIGTIEIGKKADLVIVNENPVSNFKVLYGTGHQYFNRKTKKMDRTTGIEYTIKDGIVYDAKKMLKDVRAMVADRKQLELNNAKTH
jgi:imidazolonepropionase-like amidohydrolase